MGPRAVDLFLQQGIEVLLGATGDVDHITQDFIAGRLSPGTSSCTHHANHEPVMQHESQDVHPCHRC
jgi:predicted Fe-Mo cluster-binding NifX family protein